VARLALIGLVAGFFSSLFGVGGGILIVPLLLVVAHFSERPAMATSLAAIGVTALAGVVAYSFTGRVEPLDGLLVGVPGAVGAIAGATLQQRIPRRRLSLLFALLLVIIAVVLLLG
jgi:uncharacterized membrane protein YfcA